MKHSVSLGIVASLFFACSSLAPAGAEPPAASPVGKWTFKTGAMNEGCTLSGSMTITRKVDKSMSCTFKSVWACTQVLPRSVETDQTCSAKQSGSTITITSKIAKIARVSPPEMLDFMRANYAADHFQVKIDTTGDRMDGIFHSYGQAPVIFRRHLELVG